MISSPPVGPACAGSDSYFFRAFLARVAISSISLELLSPPRAVVALPSSLFRAFLANLLTSDTSTEPAEATPRAPSPSILSNAFPASSLTVDPDPPSTLSRAFLASSGTFSIFLSAFLASLGISLSNLQGGYGHTGSIFGILILISGFGDGGGDFKSSSVSSRILAIRGFNASAPCILF